MKALQKAREAQLVGNVSEIGRQANLATSALERGNIIALLACEVAYRKHNLHQALTILNLARRHLIDEYKDLKFCKVREKYIRSIT